MWNAIHNMTNLELLEAWKQSAELNDDTMVVAIKAEYDSRK